MTPDAAGPVEAVLTADERLGYGVRARVFPGKQLVYSLTAVETLIAARLAAHGAAERRAGAVEALNEAADALMANPQRSLSQERTAEWLRARAAALSDRAGEAVES